MDQFFQYFSILYDTVIRVLRFEQDIFERVQNEPTAIAIVLGVSILGGISLLAGQTFILALNRVRPTRIFITLLLNGLLYSVNLSIWAILLWFIGEQVLRVDIPLRETVRLVLLTSAPMLFSFLVIMPYLGTPILRILQVWSLILTFFVVQFQYDIRIWTAILIVALGGIITDLLSSTIGGPFKILRGAIQGQYRVDLDDAVYERIVRPKS